MYEEASKVIPIDKIHINHIDSIGIPNIIPDWQLLETIVDPPYFKSFRTLERLYEGKTFF